MAEKKTHQHKATGLKKKKKKNPFQAASAVTRHGHTVAPAAGTGESKSAMLRVFFFPPLSSFLFVMNDIRDKGR